MATQLVRRAAPKVAAAAGASVAVGASQQASESQSQSLVLSAEDLQASAGLIKKEALVLSQDGTPWRGLEELINVATEVASDRRVQQVIHEKFKGSEGGAALSVSTESFEEVAAPQAGGAGDEAADDDGVSSGDELYHSMIEQPSLVSSWASSQLEASCNLADENAMLRAENTMLKAVLKASGQEVSADQPPATKANTEAAEVAVGVAAAEAVAEAIGEVKAEGAAEEKKAAAGCWRVASSLRVLPDGKIALLLVPEPTRARPRDGGRKADKQRAGGAPGFPQQAIVVAAAILIGLLAISVSRNPAGAKMAAATAAATVATMFSRGSAARAQ